MCPGVYETSWRAWTFGVMKREPKPTPPGRRAARWRRRRVVRRPVHRRRKPAGKTGRRRRLLLVLGAVAFALVAGGIIYYLIRPPAAAVDVAYREDVTLVLALTGEIDPWASVQVVPEVTGELVALTVPEGARVSAGQVLARIEAGEAVALLRQAEEAAASRRAELEQARRELDRSRRLFSGGAIAAQELEQSALAVEQGEFEVQRLEAAVVERRAQLDDYVIRSPMDAIVLERPVDPGQVVGPETTIYELASTDGRGVEALVDERYITDLYPGLPATVKPIGKDEVYRVRLSYVSDQVDAETGAATIRFQFVDPPPALPFGLSVDINLSVASYANALTVARQAVIAPGEPRSWVYVVEGGIAVPRAVRVIDWPAERVVVLEGLRAGEEVVLMPRQVEPGERVRAERVRS